MIATLEDLDEKSLIKILQEPKNSLNKTISRTISNLMEQN